MVPSCREILPYSEHYLVLARTRGKISPFGCIFHLPPREILPYSEQLVLARTCGKISPLGCIFYPPFVSFCPSILARGKRIAEKILYLLHAHQDQKEAWTLVPGECKIFLALKVYDDDDDITLKNIIWHAQHMNKRTTQEKICQ